ncbi:glycoside hydrolase family 2 protein [Algoriphagus litoralis]|uniref:glycoside hydrolase family 2 protein n=1 Tax=Algoriphagus litoralis TaxID=2202829 RepID=UPI000DBA7174|nr:sugar-binding domain-containing protein [Algoriphagus litoralis]
MRIFLFLCLFLVQLQAFSQTILKTPWSDQVDPTHPHPEYPEPQLVRDKWQSLNGPWDFAILPKGSSPETGFAGKITVPFPVESFLSGVQKTVGPENELWYERNFDLELSPKGKRILLKFGAVDWEAEVWVNDKQVGKHQGGFDSFSFDITDFLVKGKQQKIRVRVWDPSDAGPQPRGKQVQDPKGIWYTPVTGIWQSVYMLEVPTEYISSVYSMTDWENSVQVFYPEVTNPKAGQEVEVSVLDQGNLVATFKGQPNKPLPVRLEKPKTWSPDSPFLYDVSIKILEGKKIIDQVTSYAAYRDIRMAKDQNGHQRMFLNGKPLFHYGPLDQGWWPDGLYTAPTDEALLFDIQKTKEMGFNMIRKHVKVEPARWYYHADRLGMLVWQDMPSGDMGNRWEVRPGVIREGMYKNRTEESEEIFKAEWKEIINEFRFFPSIVAWVPFNEAWGQFKTAEITKLTRELDPSRLINSASGGNFEMTGSKVVGDILDLHNYPDPVMPDPQVFGKENILVLGEFGGLGLPLEGHTWQLKDNWGYQSFSSPEELKARYMILMEDLLKMIPKGLAAAVYTQTTDVEVETNGLMTYDRKVIKIALEDLRKIHESLYK